MSVIGAGMLLVGILTMLVGMAGFADTRKIDRRYKNGYKNNEPDTRNFRRARKLVLYGVGLGIVGWVILGLSPTSTPNMPVATLESVPKQAELPPLSSNIKASNPVVALDPQQLDGRSEGEEKVISNERHVTHDGAQASNLPAAVVSVNADAEDIPTQTQTANVSCTDDGSFFGANVCKDAALATAYGRELNEYDAAQKRIGGQDLGVRIEQQAWLENTAKSCPDSYCLTRAFETRVADLHLRYRKGS